MWCVVAAGQFFFAESRDGQSLSRSIRSSGAFWKACRILILAGSSKDVPNDSMAPRLRRRCMISREPLNPWMIIFESPLQVAVSRSRSRPHRRQQWILTILPMSSAISSWGMKMASCVSTGVVDKASSPISPIPNVVFIRFVFSRSCHPALTSLAHQGWMPRKGITLL